MRTYITNAIILTPEVTLSGKTLVLEDDKIFGLISGDFDPKDGERVIDAHGGWMTPGMIDIHVHGGAGYDTMDATQEAITSMSRYFAQHGVTSFLPTTMSATKEDISRAVDNIATCTQTRDGAKFLGIHLEGPYLNPAHRGAQSERLLRDAVSSEYEMWCDSGVVKLVSLAPEREGALTFIKFGIRRGLEFSIAHSGATYNQVTEAADCGLRQATHVFNGMSGLHHREPGTVGAVLTDDRIYVQIIADGVHVHPAVVNLVLRTKGVDRTILITDAVRAGGLPDGEYELGKEKIIVKSSVSRTLSGSLAGSTLTMEAAVKNMITFTGRSLKEIIPLATSVPARAMGWYGQKGVITPGADADIVILDRDLNIQTTIVSGRVVYPLG
jgi:N-acetylglucosamine-6-phosphate deacetylase